MFIYSLNLTDGVRALVIEGRVAENANEFRPSPYLAVLMPNKAGEKWRHSFQRPLEAVADKLGVTFSDGIMPATCHLDKQVKIA